MKKKILLAIALSIALTMGIFAVAYVVVYNATTTFTVLEAFNTTNTSMAFAIGFPGENKSANVSVYNNGTARLRSNLSWMELSNPNNVNYSVIFANDTNGGILTSDFYVDAQNTETRTIIWVTQTDSPVGIVTGQHNVTRIRVE